MATTAEGGGVRASGEAGAGTWARRGWGALLPPPPSPLPLRLRHRGHGRGGGGRRGGVVPWGGGGRGERWRRAWAGLTESCTPKQKGKREEEGKWGKAGDGGERKGRRRRRERGGAAGAADNGSGGRRPAGRGCQRELLWQLSGGSRLALAAAVAAAAVSGGSRGAATIFPSNERTVPLPPPPPHCAESMVALVQALRAGRLGPPRCSGRWKSWRPWLGKTEPKYIQYRDMYCTVQYIASWLIMKQY